MVKIEKLLEKVHSEWEEKVLYPFIESNQEPQFSLPYYIGLSKHHDTNRKSIMIVGQEASNYGQYSTLYNEWPRKKIREWNSNYVDRQLFNEKTGNSYNRSPFWLLARKLKDNHFNIIWNNLDKLHKYNSHNIKNKTKSLSEHEELPLHKAFNKTNRSLLLQEIEILNPDLLIFTIGPHYISSMAAGLMVTPNELKPFRPTVKRSFSDITELTDFKVPVYWSYHPAYLNRIDKIDDLVNEAHKALNKQSISS